MRDVAQHGVIPERVTVPRLLMSCDASHTKPGRPFRVFQEKRLSQEKRLRMKTKSLILIGCLMACIVCPAAFAQDVYPKFEFFAGYSLMKTAEYDNINVWKNDRELELTMRAGGRIIADKSNILEKGFSTTLSYNFTPLAGLSASLRYHNGFILNASGKVPGRDASGNPNPQQEMNYDAWFKKTSVAFLVGPQLTFRNYSRVTPFVYGLAGISHDRLSGIGEFCIGNQCYYLKQVDPDYCWYEECPDIIKRHNSFSVALGVGFDVSLSDSWAVRAVQADYFIASHPKGIGRDDYIRNKRYDNFTLSSGIVYRFGR